MPENPEAQAVMPPAPPSRPKVSATIICKNEEHDIRDCLASVRWADEIVVVDSGSTDRTVDIAKEYTPNVIFNAWPGHVAQKNFALSKATGEWMLSLDADERCTPELKELVLKAVEKKEFDGYMVKRHVFYLGRWINHGDWYPDWKLRLVRREKARWGGVDPHDKLFVEGPVGKLDADLNHFTYRNYGEHVRQLDFFSTVAADSWVKRGKAFHLPVAIVHSIWKFWQCYLFRLGFLDGFPGLVIAVASGFYTFSRHVKLWESSRVK